MALLALSIDTAGRLLAIMWLMQFLNFFIFIFGEIPRNTNSKFMVLIPKNKAADSLVNFRPIVLGNFFFKIITKILADCLNSIVSRIISPQEFGFIRSRCINGCIAIASESINCLDSSNGRNIAI